MITVLILNYKLAIARMENGIPKLLNLTLKDTILHVCFLIKKAITIGDGAFNSQKKVLSLLKHILKPMQMHLLNLKEQWVPIKITLVLIWIKIILLKICHQRCLKTQIICFRRRFFKYCNHSSCKI